LQAIGLNFRTLPRCDKRQDTNSRSSGASSGRGAGQRPARVWRCRHSGYLLA
jgi:hypothetical protein